jgi:tetratricopeptide (TPR) repeat protein
MIPPFEALSMAEASTLLCDFDRVMSPAHQTRWVSEVTWRDRDGLRADDPNLRGRFAPRFEQLRAMKVWNEVEAVLRRYVRAAIPAPRRSERAFWSCACLPESDEALVLARVDVGDGEVCTVTADDTLTFSFRLGLNPLDLPRFATRAGLSVADLRTRSDGDIEVVLSAVGGDAALGLFDDEVIVLGMRRLTLDLARRGPCVSAEWHNLALADALLAEAEAPDRPASLEPFDVPLTLIEQLIDRGAYEAASAALLSLVGHRVALRDDAAVLALFLRALDLRGPEAALPVARMMAAAGRAHRRTGHPARGVELLARAIERIPRDGPHAHAAHLLELGRCYTALGDPEAAIDHLDEAQRSAEHGHPMGLQLAVRGALAEAHFAAGDVGAARSGLGSALVFARVRGLQGVRAHLLAALAWCAERLGEIDEAVEHDTEALALLSHDAKPGLLRGVLAGLVRCHDRRGRRSEADAFLRRAEAMEESAWPGEGPWPLDDLIEASLDLDEAFAHPVPSA